MIENIERWGVFMSGKEDADAIGTSKSNAILLFLDLHRLTPTAYQKGHDDKKWEARKIQ